MKLTAPASFPEFSLPDELLDRPLDLIALGNAMMEMIVQVPAWPGAGGQHDVSIPMPTYTAGGCATNVACFTARLGGRAALVARLGDGRYSRPIWEEYERSRVDTTNVRRVLDKEGNLVIIMTGPDGDWSVMSYMDPELELTPADLPASNRFVQARLLHIDGFTLFNDHQKQTVERAIDQARSADCLVSIDAAVPIAEAQPDYLAKLFAKSDIVFANRFEILSATRTTTVEAAISSLRSMGPQLCCIKLGAEGSVIITPHAEGHIPAYEVEVVDTVAAGDAYIAATLLGLCRRRSLFNCVTQGSAAGSLACLGAGSLSNRFTLEDVDDLVTRGAYQADQ